MSTQYSSRLKRPSLIGEKLIARDSRGGKVETGDAPAPSPPPPPPPFPRWIHCGSTGSGLRYSVMDMFEGITLEQELQVITRTIRGDDRSPSCRIL